jgi:hypothetical protein
VEQELTNNKRKETPKMKHKKNGSNTSLAMIRRYFPEVTAVEDAQKKAIVEVTASDNSHADVKNHRTCALALACTRFFHADGVIIGLTTSWIIRGRTATRYKNAATVSREITSFDRKAGFDAGLYLLTAATASSRLGLVRSANPKRQSRKSGTRAFRHYTRNVRTTLASL